MDPLVLLIMMLRQKDFLTDNELSWLSNANGMTVNQIKFLESDGEDRALMLASMRTNSFEQARDKSLTTYDCPKCNVKGKLIPLVIDMNGQKIEIQNGLLCEECKQSSFMHEVIVKNPKGEKNEG